MWQQVGRHLERARLDRKWRPIDVERAGGPSYKTVQAIEVGDAGHVDSLEKCARALDLSIVDIVHAVLASTVTPLSPEAAHVVRKFTETTVAGRTAMLALANALPPAPGPTGPASPPAAAGPVTPRPPRPGPAAVTRRRSR
jgi:hypothetical protein